MTRATIVTLAVTFALMLLPWSCIPTQNWTSIDGGPEKAEAIGTNPGDWRPIWEGPGKPYQFWTGFAPRKHYRRSPRFVLWVPALATVAIFLLGAGLAYGLHMKRRHWETKPFPARRKPPMA